MEDLKILSIDFLREMFKKDKIIKSKNTINEKAYSSSQKFTSQIFFNVKDREKDRKEKLEKERELIFLRFIFY